MQGPLLQRSPLFESGCADETRAFFGAKDHAFEVARGRPGPLNVRINGVYLPGIYVGYTQYGSTEVSLAPGPSHSEYWLHLPLSGKTDVLVGRKRVCADVSKGVISAPSQTPCRLTAEPGSARIQLALDRAAMIRRLESLLDGDAGAVLEFAPSLDLAGGCGRSLARHILIAVRDLEQPDSALGDPVTMAAFEEFVMTALLMWQPNSYSAALRRLDRGLAPRDVKRAVAYIREHLQLPIGISDIAASAGVPGRTLFKHFRDFKGVSPMRYLRDARLARVRRALRDAEPEDNVTRIATEWGFSHMGRFSVDYRRAFGESPSRTLAARKLRMGP